MLTDLVQAEIIDDDGATRRLTADESADFAILLISAGTETVARLLGWAAVVLDANPDQRAELAADPALIPNAVEELLRFEAPSPVQGRWTTEPRWTVAGSTIPAESKVLLLTGSAGRDERKYPDADRFDIHRSFDHHVSFGYGIHFCLGRRAGPHGGPDRPRGDAGPLPRVAGRPRPRRAPAHLAPCAAGSGCPITV